MQANLDFDALRERYDEDGFVIVRGLFSPAAFRELHAQLDRYIREVVPTLPKDAAFFDDYAKPETLRKMQSLHRHDPWFDQFRLAGPQVPLLEHFLRDKYAPQGIEWFDKLPYDTQATPAHQDGFYWCRKPNLACALWIALDPVDRENGCLWYARGSQRGGILPHAGSGVLGFSQGLQNFDPKSVDGVPIELSPGDAVVHSSATIHWTEVNRTPRHRRALATFAFGASTVRDEDAFARYKESLKQQLAQRGIPVSS
jgi:phytanoyl-CoA hydroxylase